MSLLWCLREQGGLRRWGDGDQDVTDKKRTNNVGEMAPAELVGAVATSL